MSASAVLVIAHDVVIGALLASMAELTGYEPVFPEPAEPALEAITRLRPPLVLLDCDHDAACEDEAYSRAEAAGSTVILFTAMQSRDEAEKMATQRGLTAFALPIHYRELARKLEAARGGQS